MIRRFFAERIKHPRGKIVATLAILGVVALRLMMGFGCPILTLTGIPCPGCGMTRALIGALQFRFAYAFEMHSMFWSLPVIYLFFLCDGRLFRSKKLNTAVIALIALGFCINWLKHFV